MWAAALIGITLAAMSVRAVEIEPPTLQNSWFNLQVADGAIVSLQSAQPGAGVEFVPAGARVGDVSIRYRQGGAEWRTVHTDGFTPVELAMTTANRYDVRYQITNGLTGGLVLEIHIELREAAVNWQLNLRNASGQPLEIGDLAIALMNTSSRPGKPVVLKHSFLSGHGSHAMWERADSVGPFLILTPTGDTHFEYWEAKKGFRAFVHSAVIGGEISKRGTHWRQPHTSLMLAKQGQSGDARSYGFKFRWADDYAEARNIFVEEGGVDVEVVPGMTVPSDLSVRCALRSAQTIQALEAEFPESTRIESLGTNGAFHLYQVRFSRLGENRLTVRYGRDRQMFLEFFCTEPLETLIQKRASFIARCQHRDSSKWYNGLISEWNMETQTLLGPDNYDRIKGWRIYEVTCDDPGLSKPAFLAAKNAEFPVSGEVAALDYYLKHFVWGGLQRTTDESYSYAIYGIPDWKQNRESADPGSKGQQHFWRVYDYPHLILVYESLYQVARNHPEIHTELTAAEYLQRAYGTALAMFTVPVKIVDWSAYGTGFYNELILLNLIDDLKAAGLNKEAQVLRGHWERKVKNFVSGDGDLFRSEYAFDTTGFESTQALAAYAVTHAAANGNGLGLTPHESRQFMERQMAANIACRGWLEPAYYYLGSDYRGSGNAYMLTYMSQMGGWGVLDYALHFKTDAAPYLRLGYASYLSAWALMNTGTAESNYGFWYPGRANDGGAGGGFEPAAEGTTWLEQPHHRGSWYYACEIDLGFCGALRAAATILTDDPIFGRICLGGDWRKSEGRLEVIPKDGVRRRFHVRLKTGALDLTSAEEHFAAGQPIVLKEDRSEIRFALETGNPREHVAELTVSGLPPGDFAIYNSGVQVGAIPANCASNALLKLTMPSGGTVQKFMIKNRVQHP
ncbi:MAG: DUF5695 domain-containing protein [Verrucomicrobiota bacterium]